MQMQRNCNISFMYILDPYNPNIGCQTYLVLLILLEIGNDLNNVINVIIVIFIVILKQLHLR